LISKASEREKYNKYFGLRFSKNKSRKYRISGYRTNARLSGREPLT
jgi:hypothetical protein